MVGHGSKVVVERFTSAYTLEISFSPYRVSSRQPSFVVLLILEESACASSRLRCLICLHYVEWFQVAFREHRLLGHREHFTFIAFTNLIQVHRTGRRKRPLWRCFTRTCLGAPGNYIYRNPITKCNLNSIGLVLASSASGEIFKNAFNQMKKKLIFHWAYL